MLPGPGSHSEHSLPVRAHSTFQAMGKVLVRPFHRWGAQGWGVERAPGAAAPNGGGGLKSSAQPPLRICPSAPCAPLPTASTSVHRAFPSLHLAENRRLTTACVSFLYPPFPRDGGWFGQSCLSDVSQSADFASCLRLTICGYSESNWLAAIRSKLVIQGGKRKKKKKNPKLLNK